MTALNGSEVRNNVSVGTAVSHFTEKFTQLAYSVK